MTHLNEKVSKTTRAYPSPKPLLAPLGALVAPRIERLVARKAGKVSKAAVALSGFGQRAANAAMICALWEG